MFVPLTFGEMVFVPVCPYDKYTEVRLLVQVWLQNNFKKAALLARYPDKENVLDD